MLVHLPADPQNGLHDARGRRILARSGVAGDQELRDLIAERHDIQGSRAIALGDLEAALARDLKQELDAIPPSHCTCRGSRFFCAEATRRV